MNVLLKQFPSPRGLIDRKCTTKNGYQKLIQKVENTTQALSFERMISDKGHLRLSPQDFPIGSAFRRFSAFGPADSVTLLREAG